MKVASVKLPQVLGKDRKCQFHEVDVLHLFHKINLSKEHTQAQRYNDAILF